MPESDDRWISVLGRLLPRRLRERVFEPACHDLVITFLENEERAHRPGRMTPLVRARMIWVLVHVTLADFPRVLFERRRPSVLGMLLGAVLVPIGGWIWLRLQSGY